jgi:hypothetical protein
VDVAAHAELRQMERWMGIIVPRVVRCVVNGQAPQPSWLPQRWLTVVAADVDADAGVGAIWLVRRPGSAKAETYSALIERCGGQWQYIGAGRRSGGDLPAGRPAAGQPGQIGLIEYQEGASVRSYAYRQQHPRSISTAPWIETSELQVAAGVSHLLVGERRIEVPGHGRLIVAWKSPSTGARGLRPLIVAAGQPLQ